MIITYIHTHVYSTYVHKKCDNVNVASVIFAVILILAWKALDCVIKRWR